MPPATDRTRPSYPAALVDGIVAASPGPAVLDVGCGTGIVARLFQAAGCRVRGIDTRRAHGRAGRGAHLTRSAGGGRSGAVECGTKLARVSLSIGIVGLPNVGKSTLFNALTRAGALASNYPFATIDPNVGVVGVPDPRLAELAKLYDSARIVPATVRFTDIAGLVRAPRRARGSATSSWPTSARPTRSARWYGSSTTRT